MAGSSRSLALLLGGVAVLLTAFVLWHSAPGEPRDLSGAGPRSSPARAAEPAPSGLLAAPAEMPAAAPEDGNAVDELPLHSVRGRVVAADDATPIAEIVVHVELAPSEDEPGVLGALAGARTDETGAFELQFRAPRSVRIVAHPRKGWAPTGPPRRLRSSELSGDSEVVLTLRRGTSDVAFGSVIDERTLEGVFAVRVELSMPEFGLHDAAVTDANGGFSSTVSFPEGALHARVSDLPPDTEPVRLGGFERAHLEEGRIAHWKLEVPVGPTFRLAAASGPRIDGSFTAALRKAQPEERFAAVLEVTRRGLELATEKEEPATAWPALPVRADTVNPVVGAGWIRYARPPAGLRPDTEYELVVRTSDRWLGTGAVYSTEGIHPGVVAVALEPVAQVQGTVLETTGLPVSEARVLLYAAGERDGAPLAETLTGSTGAYLFANVPIGRCHLVVVPNVHAGHEFEIELTPGLNPIAAAILPPAPIAGPVAGELLVPAGVAHDRPRVTLSSNEGSAWTRTVACTSGRGPDGSSRYSFRFEDVPSGEYELTVGALGWQAGGGWSPRRHVVFPPRDGIRFHATASDETVEVRFDARLGERVLPATLRFGPGGWLSGEVRLPSQKPLRVPRDATWSWTLTAPGFQPVRGDESDLKPTAEGRGVVSVRPDPGWGLELRLSSAPPEELRDSERLLKDALLGGWVANPIQGARVYADGHLVGRSDRFGLCTIGGARPPKRIEIRAPGWRGVKTLLLDTYWGFSDSVIVLFERRETEGD